MPDTDTQTPDTPTPADTPASPSLADILATPEGQVAAAAVTTANALPHLTTGASKRMFAFNAISDGLSLPSYQAYFLIELAVKSLKESN